MTANARDESARAAVRVRILIAMALGVVSIDAHGQSGPPLFPGPATVVETGPTCVAVADFNSDRLLDVAVSVLGSQQVRVLLGDGHGRLMESGAFPVGPSPRFVATGDFDEDGQPDLVTANSVSDRVSVLRGVGDGTFTLFGSHFVGDQPENVVVADFNGDGHLDLVVSNFKAGTEAMLLGSGHGSFAFPVAFPVGDEPAGAAKGDFNGDGKLDLATACWGDGIVSILLGSGTGALASHGSLAVGSAPRSVVVGDFNVDGRDDLAVVVTGEGELQTWLGDGTGGFAQASSVAIDGINPFSAAVADIDGDGRLDLAVGIYFSGSIAILRGVGDGSFEFTESVGVGDIPGSIAIADFDADGHQDIVTANEQSQTITVVLGREGGGFVSNVGFDSGPYFHDSSQAITAGDFNGDDRADLAVAVGSFPSWLGVLLGDGDGSFVLQRADAAVMPMPESIVVGDFDEDGHEDLATANGQFLSILIGGGDGAFALAGHIDVGSAGSLSVGDFDGDGHQDLVTANGVQKSLSVASGDGAGAFTTSTVALAIKPEAVAVCDLDEDGVLDLAATDVTFGAYQVCVLRGTGNGGFELSSSYPVDGVPSSVAVGDFDANGHQDVAVASGSFESQGVTILLGDGTGGLTMLDRLVVAPTPYSLVVGDVNGDGLQDVATSNSTDSVSILLGNGDGSFASGGSFTVGNDPICIAAADFDRDGFLDLATANSNPSISVTAPVTVLINQSPGPWINLGSGLGGFTGIPSLTGSGPLEPGSPGMASLVGAAPSSAALLCLSLESTPAAFKGGTLVPVPLLLSLVLPTSPGGSVVLPWSAWPSGLSGLSLYWQFAIQDPAAVLGVALSNALRANVP